MTDTLSDVLSAVRLTGVVFLAIDASPPWVAETPGARFVAPKLMPGVEHVVEYHVVTSGSCWAGLLDEPAVKLEAGDIIVFPHGDAHVVSSAPGMRGNAQGAARAVEHERLPISISIRGGGSEETRIICGFLGCDARPFTPFLSALPRVIHLRGSGDPNSVLGRLVELAVVESASARAGRDCALARLSELLFVEAVRHHVAALGPEQIGWFAGLRDESIGRALRQFHERPAHPWSLEELAKQVGMSRSMLAERFVHFVGIPPIQYLANWRIQLAASLLRTTKSSLAQIADQVGYGSEAALSRAFKRTLGIAPAPYRRGELPAND